MSISLEVKMKSTLPNVLRRMQQKLDRLPQEAYQVFKDNTPVKTGNAKSKTKRRGNTISADYQYAGVLDKGRHMTNRGMRGSDQAPQGMTKPTLDFIKKRVTQIVRGK